MKFQAGSRGIWIQGAFLLVLLAGLSSAAWAGREAVCGDNRCNKGETPESCPADCGGGDTSPTSGSIFKADLGGMMTSMEKVGGSFTEGSIYTRPDQNQKADPKNVAFNSNGSNEVTMKIDTAELVDYFGAEAVKACFPDAKGVGESVNPFIAYEGSLHLNNYFKQRADLAAYFWFWVGDVQYVFEFRDEGEGWYGGDFPPAADDTPITRDAWYWLLRVTTRNARNACVTDGNVLAGDEDNPIIRFELSSVNACEYPYDDVDCR